MQKIIATNRPVTHGNRKISKSDQSLNQLLSLTDLPLVDEHNGKELGKVTNFMLRVRNGITEVLADIPKNINPNGKGFSLQYSGKLFDDVVEVSKFIHLALTANPKDSLTFSESDDTEVKAEEKTEEVTETTTEKEGDKKEEVKEEVKEKVNTPNITSDQLLELLSNPEVKDRLLGLLNVTLATEDKTEDKEGEKEGEKETEEVKAEVTKPIKVIVKPSVTPLSEPVKSKPQMRVQQLKFPGI